MPLDFRDPFVFCVFPGALCGDGKNGLPLPRRAAALWEGTRGTADFFCSALPAHLARPIRHRSSRFSRPAFFCPIFLGTASGSPASCGFVSSAFPVPPLHDCHSSHNGDRFRWLVRFAAVASGLADNSLGRPLGLPCRSSVGCLDCVVVHLLLMHGCGGSVGPLCNYDCEHKNRRQPFRLGRFRRR